MDKTMPFRKRRMAIKLYLNSVYGRGGYLTLDCRDGVHEDCVVCNCECHFKDIEFFKIVTKPIDIDEAMPYNPKHRRKAKPMTTRMHLIIAGSVLAAMLLTFLVVWIY